MFAREKHTDGRGRTSLTYYTKKIAFESLQKRKDREAQGITMITQLQQTSKNCHSRFS
jgi:hypothetical protein